MGGKKKKAGGKKGKGDDDEMNVGTLNAILEAQVQSMQQKIVLEQERLANSRGQWDNFRHRETVMEERMDKHKIDTKTKIGQMTEMYRHMESDLIQKINTATDVVKGQDLRKKELELKIEDLKKATEEMVKGKNEEIKESKKRIDEMSSDFAKMLKNTLAKMQDRIDFGIQSFEEGGDPGTKLPL